MSNKPKEQRIFAKGGPLIGLAIAAGMLVGIVGPASAQFFNFGGFQQRPQPQRGGGGVGGGWVGNDMFEPYQQHAPQPRLYRRQAPPPVREDFSKAPPPEKRETVPERNVLVLGDGMADWLAYGLEDAYAEQPEMGVIRRHKTISGLIKYQPKGEPADWAAAAKGILATEKPDAIVVMLGLDDRQAIREPDKADKKGKKDDKIRPDGTATEAAKPDADADADQDLADPGAITAPEKGSRSAGGGSV